MKIGGGGGRNPYLSGVNRTKKGEKAGKAKGAKGAAATAETSDVGEVAASEPLAPVDELEGPIYDEMLAAANKLDEDDLEEATRTVVVAVIRERFGPDIPAREMEDITKAITSSITGDDTLRSRLETVMQRVAKKKRK